MTAPSKPMYFILSHFNFFSPALVTAQWHKFISSKWSPTHPLWMAAKNSSVTLVRAIFNFINGNWRIADAHSSVMPSFWFSSSASKRGQRPPMAVITASVTAATLLSCSARKLCSFPICLTRPETFIKHLNKINYCANLLPSEVSAVFVPGWLQIRNSSRFGAAKQMSSNILSVIPQPYSVRSKCWMSLCSNGNTKRMSGWCE